MMMTVKVTASISCMLRSPAMCWSAASAAGPVTYAVTPGGGCSPSTIFCTDSTDSLASASPWLPASLTWTYADLPSLLCAPVAVSGSPQKSCTDCTCALSASSFLIISS